MIPDRGLRIDYSRTPARRGVIFSILALSLLVLSSGGCAEKGPILIEGVKYQAPEGVSARAGRVAVAVSAFRDLRDKKPEVIGQRQIRDSISNDLVVPGTAAETVAQAIKDALAARGIQIQSGSAWDMAEASISAERADFLVGGEINSLWIDVLSQPFRVKYKAMVKFRVSIADVKEKKILRTLNLNSTLEQEVVSYSDYTVQEMLAEALSSAVNQLLNDEEIKKRIH